MLMKFSSLQLAIGVKYQRRGNNKHFKFSFIRIQATMNGKLKNPRSAL